MSRAIKNYFLPGILSFCLFPTAMFAQSGNALGSLRDNIKFEHISLEQGLSQTTIGCILQDSKGFMWFGTQDGLNKYDGYRFTVYKHDPNNPRSISYNMISSVYEDRTGILWIGTPGGLNRFNQGSESFTRFLHDPDDTESLSDNYVNSIFEDHFGVLWIGTQFGGVNRFDRESEIFTHFQHDPDNPESLSDNIIYSIFEDHFGMLWFGTSYGGLNRFDRTTETFTRFQHDPNNPHSLSHTVARWIYEDHLGVLWIATYSGLNRYNRDSETFTRFQHDPNNPFSLSHNFVNSIYEDRTGTLWIGTAGGLNKFDRDKALFTSYKKDISNPHSLSDNFIFSIFEDHSGILWIGTQTGGINKFDQEKKKFIHYKQEPGNANSLSNNSVWSISEDDSGMLWIGTGNGLNKFNRQNHKFYHYKQDPSNPYSITANNISVVYKDRSEALWIGSIGGGLNKFDREKRTFRHYQHDSANPVSLSSNIIYSIFEDRFGILWIGTSTALNRFDRITETFTRFRNDPKNPHSISHNVIISIYEDRAGTLWFGTMVGGLNKFHRETGQFTAFKHNPDNPRSLSDNSVTIILEDRPGALWIGTSGGLNRFDCNTESFTRFTENEGLSNSYICGILNDDQGNLWISTANGLSKFNPETDTFRNYDMDDGLQSNEFNVGAYFRSKSGEMFFGGINGFNTFYPDSIQDNPNIPRVVFTAFERFNSDSSDGAPLIEKGISEKEHIQLSYKDNILTFEFAALNYRNTSKNQYAYKLEGFTDKWIQLDTQHRITFTNLDPGGYTLRVKGSNNDGIWNEEGTSLKITILPPWWRTWWAYTLYALFALMLLYSGRRFELNRQRLKHDLELEHLESEKLQEVDRLKSRFFAGISHEFRTPLTLISGPVRQLLSGEFKGDINEQYHLILRNCNRLLRLVNQLLDLSKLESGKMVLQATRQDIVALTRQLTMTFESLASVRGINLQFTGPEEPLMVYLEREHYEKIITNLLFNALKFTPEEGSVIVDCGLRISDLKDQNKSEIRNLKSEMSDFVEITVSDTGIGIPPAVLPYIFDRFYQAGDSYAKDAQGSGIGLALVKELVELHHGEISVISEVGKGSTFTVRLPLGKEHLQANEITGPTISDLGSRISDLKDQNELFQTQTETLYPQSEFRNPQSEKSQIVLIVEDNPDMRAYIRGYLSEYYRLIEAEDGVQGIKQALKHTPDLIISDVMMPNMDGFQFCEKIKTDERTSHIPVILLTARASGESKITGLETGADDYLTKPFDAKELRVRVNNLIEQRRRLRERFRRELVIQPSEVTVTSMDEAFLKKVMAAVEAHIDDPAFETDDLAREAGVSRRHLNRKLRALTGQSVREVIRTLRLKRAAQLLQQKSGTVTEIAYEVGFQSIAHFAKIFREEYGVAPSEYGEEVSKKERE